MTSASINYKEKYLWHLADVELIAEEFERLQSRIYFLRLACQAEKSAC